jgi:hypothetical protein
MKRGMSGLVADGGDVWRMCSISGVSGDVDRVAELLLAER